MIFGNTHVGFKKSDENSAHKPNATDFMVLIRDRYLDVCS